MIATPLAAPAQLRSPIGEEVIRETLDALVAKHGADHRAAIEAGLAQVAGRWQEGDGDEAAFKAFCLEHYVADPAERQRLVDRLERFGEVLEGHLYEIGRQLRRWSDLVGDDLRPVDDLLATFNPAPDLSDQLYRQKLAFVALLNLRRPDLSQMLAEGADWSVTDWVAARLAQQPGARIPAELDERRRQVYHTAGTFVDRFHVPVGGMVDAGGKTWFDAERKLIAHWLIREQIKTGYAEDGGITLQRALAHVMGRHVDGSIPQAWMDGASGASRWDPEANTLDGAAVPAEAQVGPARYAQMLAHADLARAMDAYYPEHPTALSRVFELRREIPEAEVEAQLVALLDAPERAALTDLVRRRLGRPLEAFDIYFEDLQAPESAEHLNGLLRQRFPTPAAFEEGLPQLLVDLGYPATDAAFLGTRIRVEIAKGAGHAMPPSLPEYPAWLRTNSLGAELGWDGFDTGMHELGHNLEQLCSHHFITRPALRGVPNNACTEAFAFLYQGLGRQVMGLVAEGGEQEAFDLAAVQAALAACQIAGPALLELHAWRWMYAHPDAGAEALRDEVLRLAEDLWSRYYAEHYGADPYHILGAYQHMVAYPLYLPDYALGHIISHQIQSHLRGRDLATETKRICSIGRVTPDLWMKRAVGQGISVAPLMADAAAAAARMA